jgi:two-component system, chemotaxis family, chemotaxis protein CheY
MTTTVAEKPAAGVASEVGRRADYDVLVVEDDDDCREILFSLLCSEGYRVETAASGTEALDALARMNKPPRLVFLDMVMPGMNGFEFLHAMRRAPSLAAIPVVVHSGLSEDAALDAQLDVKRWLQKPAPVDELLDVTRELTR